MGLIRIIGRNGAPKDGSIEDFELEYAPVVGDILHLDYSGKEQVYEVVARHFVLNFTRSGHSRSMDMLVLEVEPTNKGFRLYP